jgi:HD superfamily phosphohydrolase
MVTTDVDDAIARAVAETLNCQVTKRIDTGSTARVFIVERQLRLAGAGTFTRCVKVFRHELSADPRHESLLKHFMREADMLLKISHPNVVKLFDADFLSYDVAPGDTVPVPFLETEAVVNPRDLDDYLKSTRDPEVQTRTFMRFLRDCADALRHFHEHRVYHMDIKPANVVVGADGVPRITDFGFARAISAPTSDASSSIYTTQKWFPEYYLTRHLLTPAPTKGKPNPNRTPYRLTKGVQDRSVYNHGTDLHMFVATARYLLSTILTADARRRLDEELLNDVFDTFTINAARPRGEDLPTAEAFIRAIEAASHVDSSPTQTPELRGGSFVRTTRVAPNIHVGITRATDAVIESPAFQRLRSTIQLGFCDYVYPSARHSRFEHSLGTYYWAREYVAALLRNRGSVVFRELFTSADIQTVLLAALLHDIGQHAVAHNFEEEDSDQTFKHLGLALVVGPDGIAEVGLPPVPREFGMPLLHVARRAGATINEDLFRYLSTLDFDGPPPQKTWSTTSKSTHPEWELLAEIISGPLDVDKLDYLQRDSYSCGLTYHQLLDTPRLLQSLAVIDTTRGPDATAPRFNRRPWHPQRHPTYSLGIDHKGMIIVETFFFLRKLMLSQVYWHKTVRGVHSLVAFAYRHAKAEAGDKWPTHLREIFFLDRSKTITKLAEILRRSKHALRRQIASSVVALHHRSRRLPQLGLELAPPGEFGPVLKRVQSLKARARDMSGEIWLRYQEEIHDLVSKMAGLSPRDGIVWADVPNHPVAGTRNSATNLHYKTKDGVLRGVQTATLSAIEDDALVKETPRYRIYCSTRSGAEKIRNASEAIINALRHTA